MTDQKPSLNKMVLEVLSTLQQDFPQVSARQVRDAVSGQFGIEYPIQTIIVVLNRFVQKEVVHRHTTAGPETRQRYEYYLAATTEAERQALILKRFEVFAQELFDGDVVKAFEVTESLLDAKGLKPDNLLSYSDYKKSQISESKVDRLSASMNNGLQNKPS